MPKKVKLSHLRHKCIGCGACEQIAPEYWTMNDEDGKSDLRNAIKKNKTFVAEIPDADVELNQMAEYSCPVNIIKVHK